MAEELGLDPHMAQLMSQLDDHEEEGAPEGLVITSSQPDIPFHEWLALEDASFDTKETYVSTNSSVESFNRSVDAAHGSAVFVVKGTPPQLYNTSRFTRDFEQIGHIMPNLWLEVGRTATLLRVPERITVVNAKDSECFVVGAGEWYARTGFTRFNLFCGKVLSISSDALPTPCPPIVSFTNVRELEVRVSGINANALIPEVVKMCETIDEADPEWSLVEQALRRSSEQKTAPELEPYNMPFHWLDLEDCPEPVRAWIRDSCDIGLNLPVREDLSKAQLLDALLSALSSREHEYSDETRENFLVVRARVKTMSEVEKGKFYDELQEVHYEVRGERSHTVILQDVYAKFQIWDFNTACNALASFDPKTIRLDSDRTILSFDFDGLSYSVQSWMYGAYAPPSSTNAYLSVEGATVRLNQALESAGTLCSQGKLHALKLNFSAVLQSSCRSVSTRRQSREHGRNSFGILWSENLTVTIVYFGIWFVPDRDRGKDAVLFTRQLNNQILAETIRGRLRPAETYPAISTSLPLPLPKSGSVYMDSPSIENGFVLNPPLDWSGVKKKQGTLLSGLGRILPEPILLLGIKHNTRVKLPNVEEYAAGRQALQISLKDEKGPTWRTFTWTSDLNVNVDPKTSAADWYQSMKAVQPNAPPPSAARPGGRQIAPRGRGRGVPPAGRRTTNTVPPPPAPKTESVPEPKSKEATTSEETPTADAVTSRSGETLEAVKRTPLDGPEFEVGNWLCRAVQRLPVDVRRYWASRASDRSIKKETIHSYEELRQEWVDSLRDYAPIPRIGDKPGSGRNWYVAESDGWLMPEVFRRESLEADPLPTSTKEGEHPPAPSMIRGSGPNKPVPAWRKIGGKKRLECIFL